MKYMKAEIAGNNILVITIDSPGADVNVITKAMMEEVSSSIGIAEKDGTVRGIVIMSGKKDNFIAGADLEEFLSAEKEEDILKYITGGHAILKRIKALKIPVITAINGSCMGGGFELSLFTTYRMASNSPSTFMGLPEVLAGLFPAGGGTQLLPGLIGLTEALPILLTGKRVRPKEALRIGLIDEVVPAQGLREAAIKRADLIALNGIPKKRPGKIKRPLIIRALESTSIGRKIILKKALAGVMKKTAGLYPAPLEVLKSVSYGYRHGMEKGLAKDGKTLARLVTGAVSKSLISIFFSMNRHKKNPFRDKPAKIEKLAILGAGLMGTGIASISLPVCGTILLKDSSMDRAAAGMKQIWDGLMKQVKSGSISRFEAAAGYGRVVPCHDYSGFKNTGLVIEAVFEDLNLKKKVLRDMESNTGRDTIFASNTSAIPIASIAEGCKHPENVIGMHYFSPVPGMPLLEIIRTSRTSNRAASAAVEFGLRQGKTCIIVKDGPGFYTTRVISSFLMEAGILMGEGVPVPLIDRAMVLSGFPMGPAALMDEIGIDVALHVSRVMEPLFSKREIIAPPFQGFIEKGFLGRKSGMGFYRYDLPKKKGSRIINNSIHEIIGKMDNDKIKPEDIQKRLTLRMAGEAILCLEEGIISSPDDGDIGAVMGVGFPPLLGGPFRYADSIGAAALADEMNKLRDLHGNRFQPQNILLAMAGKNGRFHRA